jgi:hypothetical protein
MNRSTRASLVLSVLLCGVALIAHGVTAAESGTTALAAAKQYADLFKAGQAGKAVETYWDFETMLAGVFGDDLKKQKPADVAEMRKLMLKIIKGVFANPDVAKTMASATYADFASKPEEVGREAVDFTVSLQEKKVTNRLLMVRKADAWRVVDAGPDGRMMVPLLKAEYQKALKAGQVKTPLDYVRAMAGEPAK